MTIPLETFWPESVTIYPDPPWLSPRQVPEHWFRANCRRFVYSQAHIIAEAAPYVFGAGPYRPGIYFLLQGSRITYVGMSNGISRRLMQHAEKDWDPRWVFDRYWCFGGVPELYMREVEGFYIDTLKPRLNGPTTCGSTMADYVSTGETMPWRAVW